MTYPPIPALERLDDRVSFEQLREAVLTDIRSGYEILPETLCLYLGDLTQPQLHELKDMLFDAPAIYDRERTDTYPFAEFGYPEASEFLADYIVTRPQTRDPNSDDIRLKQILSGLGM